MLEKMGPVFVVGVNGSGTTMLSDALGQHPDLYMLPDESRVLPYFMERFSDFALEKADKRRALADELGASRAYRRANGKQPVVLIDAEERGASFNAVVGGVYEVLASDSGKCRWGDKSPMYLQHIEALAMRFPSSQFVHIYRDARDAAQSFHRRWKQEPRRLVYRWKESIRAGREQGIKLGPSRYYEVSYENLTSEPELYMEKICAFLGLRFNNVVLHSPMRWMDETSKQTSQGKIVQNAGKWRSYFSEEEIRSLEAIAGLQLKELGYEVSLDGDENPDHFRLMLWKWSDRINFTADHFKSYGPGSLPGFTRRVRDAFRQGKMNKY